MQYDLKESFSCYYLILGKGKKNIPKRCIVIQRENLYGYSLCNKIRLRQNIILININIMKVWVLLYEKCHLNFFCDPCNMKTWIPSFHQDLDPLISEQKCTQFPEPSLQNFKENQTKFHKLEVSFWTSNTSCFQGGLIQHVSPAHWMWVPPEGPTSTCIKAND